MNGKDEDRGRGCGRLEMANANDNSLDASTGLAGWNVTGTRGKFYLRASRKIVDDGAFFINIIQIFKGLSIDYKM